MNKRTLVMHHQQGAVLLVGLIMLLVLMLGAVSMMSSSVQDERMSGNTRRGADAFMAAEAGMNRALYELDAERWYTFSCDAETGYTQATGTFIGANGGEPYGNGANYQVEFAGDCTEVDGVIEGVRLRSVGTQAGANRTIEFMSGHSTPTWPALFINDNGNCDFESGTSNNFLFDGNGGAAVGSNSPQCLANIEADIEAVDRRDNYDGALINYNPAPDFTSPEGLQRFYEAAVSAYHSGAAGVNVVDASGYRSRGQNDTMDKTELEDYLTADGGRDMGTAAPTPSNDPSFNPAVDIPDMKTTIVQGNLNITGSITGAGILIVTGDVYFGGTPDWDGIIVVLGGNATIGGGGNSNTGFEGTMIVSDVYYGGDPTNPSGTWTRGGMTASDMVEWDVSGGGGGNYLYYCHYVRDARTQLRDELLAQGYTEAAADDALIPDPDCSAGGEGDLGKAYVVEWNEVVNE